MVRAYSSLLKVACSGPGALGYESDTLLTRLPHPPSDVCTIDDNDVDDNGNDTTTTTTSMMSTTTTQRRHGQTDKYGKQSLKLLQQIVTLSQQMSVL